MIIKQLNSTNCIPVDFVLRAGKQSNLIQILNKHASLTPLQLAEVLDISLDDLVSVIEKKSFLDMRAVEKLISCFCLWIGN